MANQLNVSIGQCSSKGRKEVNQDFYGVSVPNEPMLSSKGIAVALADGISSSDVSQIASATAVKGFLEDYYCTSESWTVKTSALRVLLATNTWLHSQTLRSQYRFNIEKGYVCTFSSIIFKSTTAHIFHVGDSRIYRLSNKSLETLTQDHRTWASKETSYLSRALGMKQQVELDYQPFSLEIDDIFILATDGIYEHAQENFIIEAIELNISDLNKAAELILEEAYKQGSADNLTIQIIKIDDLPTAEVEEIYQQLTTLPFPPKLEPRMLFDGYEIVRDIYVSSRSYVYLAKDIATDEQVIIKAPSVSLRDDAAYLERFLMEDWVAKRINSAHVLKPSLQTRKRNFLYIVTEFIEGQTLAQWMLDTPKPDIETVRNIIEQIAKGLQSFHRQEMLHQDMRPNNVMIDKNGTVKIIDFGSTMVAGLSEISSPIKHEHILGTALFTAPEYFLGEQGTRRSDLFSLAVIAYQLLSGRFPYGTEVAKSRTRSAQNRLTYQSVLDENRDIPTWVDDTLKKALHPNPEKRYSELSEFVHDLRHPNNTYLNKSRPPLLDRNPLLFWKCLSLILAIIIAVLLSKND